MKQIQENKPSIPALDYDIKNFSDWESITRLNETKVFIFMNLLRSVKDGIDENKSEADLFRVGGTNYILCIDRDDWKIALENAKTFFQLYENYEICAMCNELISQL